MTLEKDFPDDPTEPSLRYAVTTLMPLAIPWTNTHMQIGTSLLESPQGSRFQFGQELAFSLDSLHSAPLIFTKMGTGLYNDASMGGSSNAYKALSLDVAGSIGGSVIGGSARGQYGKNSNEDASVSLSI